MSTGRAKQEFNLPDFCRAVAEASPMPMAAVEEANYILRYVNPAFCSLTGKPEEELIGNQFCSVVPAGEEFRSLLDRVYRTGQAETHTGQEDANSHPFYWSYAMWPLLSGDNSPEGIVVQITETTPSHRKAIAMNQALMIGAVRQHELAEEALWEGAERFRFMAESMPQKIFRAKPNGDVDYFNQQWTEFTGLPFAEIKNWGWTQFIHPEELEANVRHWRHSVETGEFFQCMHRFRRADGVYRWHLTRAHAMHNADGRILLWIGSSTDVHETKETEQELRRANENLNQFAFSASHDLQEPLRMITVFSDLLAMRYGGALDKETSVCVGYIAQGAKRMSELLTDLLSYTRAGADSEESAGTVEFNAIFDEATRNLQAAIAESGAMVSRDDLPAIHGHAAHFLQILQNLIGNALKYRGEVTPQIHVSAEQRTGQWQFAVSDNGIGIAPEYQKKIFGVFKRLHGKEISGTGIGLAICQRLVERYGGRIWVESEPDRGATFYFTLPIELRQIV